MARELVGASRGPHVTGHMFLHFLNIGEFVYLSFRLGILCTQTKSWPEILFWSGHLLALLSRALTQTCEPRLFWHRGQMVAIGDNSILIVL